MQWSQQKPWLQIGEPLGLLVRHVKVIACVHTWDAYANVVAVLGLTCWRIIYLHLEVDTQGVL